MKKHGWRITEPEPGPEPVLTVGKGPRGKFYVKRGNEIASPAFETEAEADAKMAEMAAESQ